MDWKSWLGIDEKGKLSLKDGRPAVFLPAASSETSLRRTDDGTLVMGMKGKGGQFTIFYVPNPGVDRYHYLPFALDHTDQFFKSSAPVEYSGALLPEINLDVSFVRFRLGGTENALRPENSALPPLEFNEDLMVWVMNGKDVRLLVYLPRHGSASVMAFGS